MYGVKKKEALGPPMSKGWTQVREWPWRASAALRSELVLRRMARAVTAALQTSSEWQGWEGRAVCRVGAWVLKIESHFLQREQPRPNSSPS